MKIKKKSNLVYDTSSGGDLGIFIVSVQKGTLKLKNMSDRQTTTLYYGAAGVSQSLGAPIGLSFSTEEMPSSGDVFVSDNVSGHDLQPSDFDGLCFIHGASFNAGGVGASRSMLFFGIPWTKVPTQILKGMASNLIDVKSYLLGPLYQVYKAGKLIFGSSADLPNVLRPLVGEAKGVIITQGQSVGPALNIGGSMTFGYISSVSDAMPWELDIKSSYDVPVGYKVSAQDTTIVKLPSDVLFAFDKDQIGSGDGGLPKAEASLYYIAFIVKFMRPRALFTEGHTDWIGGREYNQRLSERRARAVQSWLASKGKLTVPITPVGFGLTMPAADNKTVAGRAQNRRVEFRILN